MSEHAAPLQIDILNSATLGDALVFVPGSDLVFAARFAPQFRVG